MAQSRCAVRRRNVPFLGNERTPFSLTRTGPRRRPRRCRQVSVRDNRPTSSGARARAQPAVVPAPDAIKEELPLAGMARTRPARQTGCVTAMGTVMRASVSAAPSLAPGARAAAHTGRRRLAWCGHDLMIKCDCGGLDGGACLTICWRGKASRVQE